MRTFSLRQECVLYAFLLDIIINFFAIRFGCVVQHFLKINRFTIENVRVQIKLTEN